LESDLFFGASFAPVIDSGFVPESYSTLKKVGKLHDRLTESTVTINVLYDEVDAFQLQVKGALTKVSTVKKLAEMWPEAVPYLPEVERREATSTALAIPVETLNALCGILKNEYPLRRVFYRPYIGRFSSLPIYDNRRPSTAH
ncbi:Nmad5 family putative nucleotide modification protein, partial [Escherichia coli]|uniref:Nmad5 family putative nucleotide modification protein n=1 Tax=Escherichia coli TaxID=562 RepID=UPI0035942234